MEGTLICEQVRERRQVHGAGMRGKRVSRRDGKAGERGSEGTRRKREVRGRGEGGSGQQV